jgi:DNA primase
MTNDEIRAVARTARISDYLTERGVDLIKAGRKTKCCCPLPDHSEKTPSFFIGSKDDGTEVFKCYGCSAYGDVISLVMKVEGVGFVEAMRRLSFKVGIKLSDGKGAPAIHVEMPEKDVLINLSPEDDYGASLSKMLWAYLETLDFSENAIDKVSKAYAAYDRLIAENDSDGIIQLIDNVSKARMGEQTDFEV